MRIPFDIKYRPEIESGKYKIVVGERDARIVCWDYNGESLIVCVNYEETEQGMIYDRNGKHKTFLVDKSPDLEIITDEPEELTEFEKAVKVILLTVVHETPTIGSYVKEKSSELLTLAKETLEKEGWVGDLRKYYYKKGYEDAMRVYGEIFTYNYPPPVPTCVLTNKCTNPQHDCINCPQQAPIGVTKTDTKIE